VGTGTPVRQAAVYTSAAQCGGGAALRTSCSAPPGRSKPAVCRRRIVGRRVAARGGDLQVMTLRDSWALS